MNRAVVIVLDSVGVGALPDAARYGDEGANTLLHVAKANKELHLPHLQRMGLGNIIDVPGVEPTDAPLASFGRMMEASQGKDTTVGHWELMGLIVEEPFTTYPHGFPNDLIEAFLEATGFERVLGNRAASGTVIIEEEGPEHLRTGHPIVYTSADSVFQIAAHDGVLSVPELYDACSKARTICDRCRIGRVIARPFTGSIGAFKRTADRRDFSMEPFADTALDRCRNAGVPVVGIGKIDNIYAGRGITRSVHTKDNRHGMRVLLEELERTSEGLLFINLVDFDMIYGHRNDAVGYARALEAFDIDLASVLEFDDPLIITADHGCDPTWTGTDHTREYVPVLFRLAGRAGVDLGTRTTFADVGATVLSLFGIEPGGHGLSLMEEAS
jgi:phosphopentomutase